VKRNDAEEDGNNGKERYDSLLGRIPVTRVGFLFFLYLRFLFGNGRVDDFV